VIATTPEPPYVAVIFTSIRATNADEPYDEAGYAATADRMDELAREQDGYLGIESARSSGGLGITVSYWRDEASARAWKGVAEHLAAQRLGRERWYASYRTRVAQVGREYGSD
jgi:heme-degrading monooxygenase HmoA